LNAPKYFNEIYSMWSLSSTVSTVNVVKKFATIPEISSFSYGFTFLAHPVAEGW